jgi:glycosyltransferase involved in cell wall biosynthesis
MPAEAEPTLAPHCILLATADWDTPYWTNKQHTASQLAQKGWKVLYVESVGLRAPRLGSGLDLGRLARRLWRGLKGVRKVQDNVWVLSPLVLPVLHSHPWVRAFNQGLLAWMVRRFMHVQGSQRPLIWTYHPYVLELLQRLNAQAESRTGSLVYHCVDDLAAIPGVDATAFRAEERRLLEQADMVFTTSAALRDQCSPYNAQVHFHPNVVDLDHFAQAHRPGPLPADLQTIPEPRLAYIGALSDFKIDFQLLIEVAKARPEWNLVLIGEEREGQRSALLQQLGSLPNVHLLGYKTYAQLPDYLRGLNVGLLPTLVNDYTHGMFPMKYFEYLAAGLPVVSTPLAFTREPNLEMRIAATSEAFVAAIEAQLQRSKYSEQQSRSLVGHNTWGFRIDRMLEELQRQALPTKP